MNIPNVLTIIRVLLIPVFVAFYFINMPYWYAWAGLIFVIASFTDWLDGYLARKWNQVTTFGKFVDPIADKLLVLAALLLLLVWGKLGEGFGLPSGIGLLTVLILLSREFIISGFRLVAASKGVVIAADKSGKLKTALQMVSITLLLFNGLLFGDTGIWIGLILIYASVVISIYSCIEYIVKNKQVLKENE
jgi:CDP-diacylglycerol--glycerol-3-phosphate 3-phosphatidyltransferase